MIPTTNSAPRMLNIQLLAIDLSTCSRCTRSLSNVEQAIAILQPIRASTGTVIQFQTVNSGNCGLLHGFGDVQKVNPQVCPETLSTQ